MTSSVTGCSTWMRPFSSRKKKSRPSRTNSAVPGAPVADRAREGDRRLAHPRAAAPSSRAGEGDSSSTFWCRRWTEHSRSPSATARAVRRRRAAGSRRGGGAPGSARRRRCRRRTPPSPPGARPRAPRRARRPSGRLASRGRRRLRPPSRAAESRARPGRPRRARGRRPRVRPASPPACRRPRAGPRARARRRRARPPRPPRRSRRSRRGSRSPGWTASAPARFAARRCSSGSRYEAISTVSSAERAWSAPASSGATTATVAIPSSRQVRKMRTAISPRFATRSLRIGTASRYVARPGRTGDNRRRPGRGIVQSCLRRIGDGRLSSSARRNSRPPGRAAWPGLAAGAGCHEGYTCTAFPALVEERAQPFLALVARPDARPRGRAASSSSRGSSTSRFASRTAAGPPARRSATTRSTAASRSAATSSTSPIRERGLRVEPLAGEEVAASGRRARSGRAPSARSRPG